MAAQHYSRIEEQFSIYNPTAARAGYFTCHKDLVINCLQDGSSTYTTRAWSGGRKQTLTGQGTSFLYGTASGICPHGGIPILFGKQDNPDDWWDTTRVAKARLVLTPRVLYALEAVNTSIIIQQAKLY